jgi:hypothetical protein
MGKAPDKQKRVRRKMSEMEKANRFKNKQIDSKVAMKKFFPPSVNDRTKVKLASQHDESKATSISQDAGKQAVSNLDSLSSFASSDIDISHLAYSNRCQTFIYDNGNEVDQYDDYEKDFMYEDVEVGENEDSVSHTVMGHYLKCLQERLQLECNGLLNQLQDTWLTQLLHTNEFTLKKEIAKSVCQKLKSTFMHPSYYRDVHFWLPDMQYNFMPVCPQCLSNHSVGVHGYDAKRLVVSFPMNYFIFSRRYICHSCAKKKEPSVQYTFRGYNPTSLKHLPQFLMLRFPAFFTHKIGIDLRVIDLMRPLFELGVKPSSFRDMIKELHHKEHNRLAILHEAKACTVERFFGEQTHYMFSAFDDMSGYAGYVPGAKWFRSVYIKYMDTIRGHLDNDVKKLPMETMHMDVSYKCAKRIATLSGGVRVCQGLVTIMNEIAEVRSQFLLSTDAHDQYHTPLREMQDTFRQYGHEGPRYAFIDNPSRDRDFLLNTFPSLRSQQLLLDSFLPVGRNSMDIDISTISHKKSSLLTDDPVCKDKCKWKYFNKFNDIDANAEAIRLVFNASSETVFIALDAEWCVPFNRHGRISGPPDKISLIQLAYRIPDEEEVKVVLYHVHGFKVLPPGLIALLQSQHVKFVGCAIAGDLRKIMRDFDTEICVDNGIDLRGFATKRGVHCANQSLSALCETVLRFSISKAERFGDWSSKPLSNQLQLYAAMDAYVSLQIFTKLSMLVDLTVPPDVASLVKGLRVDICPWYGNLSALGRCVATGVISDCLVSSWDVPTNLHFTGTSNTQTGKKRHFFMIEIEQVLAPAVNLMNIKLACNKKRSATFGDLGSCFPVLCPIPLDMIRSHVEDRQLLSEKIVIPKAMPITTTGVYNISSISEKKNCADDGIVSMMEILSDEDINDDADDELKEVEDDRSSKSDDEGNEDAEEIELMEPHHIGEIESLIANCEKYRISLPLQTSFESTEDFKLDPPPVTVIQDRFSSVLGSCFHACHRFIVPTHHSYKKPFYAALSEAFFSWDDEDMKVLMERLKSILHLSDKEILNLRYYKRSFFTKRVRRYVLPPSRLYWRVRAVIEAYATRRDADSNKPLFNKLCWQKANGILQEILLGYYSDPPGLDMYQYEIDPYGAIKLDTRLNTPLLKCRRDTNMVENSHKHLLNTFGEFNIGIRFFDCVLAEHRHRSNTKASIRNRMNYPDFGHYDSWMIEVYQNQVLDTHDTLIYPGFINTSEFHPTDEKFGFVDICPQDLKFEINKLNVTDSAQSSEDLMFLRKSTGLKLVPLPWHTKEELRLYPKLVLEAQEQNVCPKQLYSWMAQAVLRFVDGIFIHPKLEVYNRLQHKTFMKGARIKNAITNIGPVQKVLESLNKITSNNSEIETYSHEQHDSQFQGNTPPREKMFGLLNYSTTKGARLPPALPLSLPPALYRGYAPTFVGGIPIRLPPIPSSRIMFNSNNDTARARGKDNGKRRSRRCTRCRMESCPAAKSGPGVKVCSNPISLPLTVPTTSGPEKNIRVNEKPASMTSEEKSLIEGIFNSNHNLNEVLARIGQDSVTKASMQSLKPGVWVRDEPLNGFMHLLNMILPHNHHFNSFFITLLLDEKCSNKYSYDNVRRWSTKVPGGDVFSFNMLFFPVNIGRAHWSLVVAHLMSKKIEYYDSLGYEGSKYVDAVYQYLVDEFRERNKGELGEWQKIYKMEGPSQKNGNDCGVFTCVSALWLSKGNPLEFTQNFITDVNARELMALSILQGRVHHKLTL